jgi:hypothetical protein
MSKGLTKVVAVVISTERETGKKWQIRARWEPFSVGKFVILGSVGNFYI